MPLIDIPDAPQGNIVWPKRSTWNLLVAICRWVTKFRVAPPLLLQDTQAGPLLSLAVAPNTTIRLVNPNAATGAGWYSAKVLLVSSNTSDPSTDLVSSALGTSVVDCFVANSWEIGLTGHKLVTDGSKLPIEFSATPLPPKPDGTPCFMITAKQSVAC